MIESKFIELNEQLAKQFKALGDPTRLRILQVLADGPRCVCQIQPEMSIAANLLSHHLKVLREAKLVRTARDGRLIYYRLNIPVLKSLRERLPKAPGTEQVCGKTCRPS